MKLEIVEDVRSETIVLLDNKYWLGKTQTCVTWWADVVDPSEWQKITFMLMAVV